jgi:hypothetical protein
MSPEITSLADSYPTTTPTEYSRSSKTASDLKKNTALGFWQSSSHQLLLGVSSQVCLARLTYGPLPRLLRTVDSRPWYKRESSSSPLWMVPSSLSRPFDAQSVSSLQLHTPSTSSLKACSIFSTSPTSPSIYQTLRSSGKLFSGRGTASVLGFAVSSLRCLVSTTVIHSQSQSSSPSSRRPSCFIISTTPISISANLLRPSCSTSFRILSITKPTSASRLLS